MHNTDIETLKKEIEELGIINIHVDGERTSDALEEFAQIAKDVKRDFDIFAKQMEEQKKVYI